MARDRHGAVKLKRREVSTCESIYNKEGGKARRGEGEARLGTNQQVTCALNNRHRVAAPAHAVGARFLPITCDQVRTRQSPALTAATLDVGLRKPRVGHLSAGWDEADMMARKATFACSVCGKG